MQFKTNRQSVKLNFRSFTFKIKNANKWFINLACKRLYEYQIFEYIVNKFKKALHLQNLGDCICENKKLMTKQTIGLAEIKFKICTFFIFTN